MSLGEVACAWSAECPLAGCKKKYSKVDESIKQRFLQCIILQNMSIKEASRALNINYSSAKAILASHRKTITRTQNQPQLGRQADYRTLHHLQSAFLRFTVVCSTGGGETSQFANVGMAKQVHKPSVSPVIVLRMEKGVDSSENTFSN